MPLVCPGTILRAHPGPSRWQAGGGMRREKTSLRSWGSVPWGQQGLGQSQSTRCPRQRAPTLPSGVSFPNSAGLHPTLAPHHHCPHINSEPTWAFSLLPKSNLLGDPSLWLLPSERKAAWPGLRGSLSPSCLAGWQAATAGMSPWQLPLPEVMAGWDSPLLTGLRAATRWAFGVQARHVWGTNGLWRLQNLA